MSGLPNTGTATQAAQNLGIEVATGEISNTISNGLSYIGPVITIGTTAIDVYSDLQEGSVQNAAVTIVSGSASYVLAGQSAALCGAYAAPGGPVVSLIAGAACGIATSVGVRQVASNFREILYTEDTRWIPTAIQLESENLQTAFREYKHHFRFYRGWVVYYHENHESKKY
jgi:uncharacterized Zn-binding protein involved in type VI secretion